MDKRQIASLYEAYADDVYRLALGWLHCKHDAEDILQNIFIKLMDKDVDLFPGSEKTCGIFLGVYLGWFVERRWIRFEVKGTLISRILQYVLGMGFVLAMYKGLLPVVAKPFSENIQTLIINGFTFFTVTALWPAMLRLFNKKK